MTKQSLLMTTAAALVAAMPAFAQTNTTNETSTGAQVETSTDVEANAETGASGETTANAETAMSGTTATAAAELNLRAGPGPDMEIIDVIPADGEVTVEGCLESANWCRVTLDGTTGWAYGDYLTVQMAEAPEPVVLYENRSELEVETVTYDNEVNNAAATAAGAATAAAGAAVLAAGPVGILGAAAIGAALGDGATPNEQTITYVRENPIDPVLLEGEVVVGAGIPQEVELSPIPDAEYSYLYVNGTPVLVEPEERRVVYIVR
ncbi:DUF1236 domain-containing protein [Limimaricola cinnabarinus]|uniref:Hypotheical conserved protein n=1 Tax=Limimaricola cinnabarinus LL-001 TaxID=1337093 RepID=U3AGS6_9RHOB|nr:DUF1236 domain-containing protein [Limimaricola cinnabarinus]GAD56874.1 hypotheical conserved protein [Limimaricola cinnabarinus LL-001]